MMLAHAQGSERPVKDSAQSMHSARSSGKSDMRTSGSGSTTVRSMLDTLVSGRGGISAQVGRNMISVVGLSKPPFVSSNGAARCWLLVHLILRGLVQQSSSVLVGPVHGLTFDHVMVQYAPLSLVGPFFNGHWSHLVQHANTPVGCLSSSSHWYRCLWHRRR